MLVGCESGVEVCDGVTAAWSGFPTNGTAHSAARRDKYLMGEAVRQAGLRAVRQAECASWAEAAPFVAELGVGDDCAADGGGGAADGADAASGGGGGGAWCVLKPTKSAGTDGVFIAKSTAEARRRFGEILGAANVFGESNQTVLAQECVRRG